MNFFWGLIGVIIGILVMKYSISLTNTFGKIDWAETHMSGGMGGTYAFYRFAGLVIVILSLLYIFGAMGFITGPLAPIFGGAR